MKNLNFEKYIIIIIRLIIKKMWLLTSIIKLSNNLIKTQLNSGISLTSIRNGCYRASIGRVRRPIYSRLYPVTLVKYD